MDSEIGNTQIMKRRLVTVYLLSFWANLVFSYTVPYNPLHRSEDYFFFVIALVTCVIFALLITRRKYRLPRRYVLALSLTTFCIANSILSIGKSSSNHSSRVAVLVISKVFIGVGWSASTYLTITLLCWFYSGLFPKLFAVLQVFSISGYISGTLIYNKDYDSRRVYIAFSVVSGLLCPILYNIPGDLTYSLGAERFTVVDYCKKSRILINAMFLGFLLFSKAFIVYGISGWLDSENRLLGGLADAIGGIIGMIVSIFINFKLERSSFILFISLTYSVSLIFIGPWRVILSPMSWLTLLSLFISGFLLQILTVNKVSKMLLYSTTLYSLQFDPLICECIGSIFVLIFSVSSIIGPVFGLVFHQFTDFSTTSTIIGLTLIVISFVYYRKNKYSILTSNVAETEPVQMEPIHKSINNIDRPEKSLVIPSLDSEPVPEPISADTFCDRLSKKSEFYEYNFLGIQTGYYAGEEFPSLSSNKGSNSQIVVSMNHSLPIQKLKQVGDTIVESKNEESSSDKPEESKRTEHSEEIKVEEGGDEDKKVGESQDKKVEESDDKKAENDGVKQNKNKYRTQPPVFKDAKIQIEVEAAVSLEVRNVELSSSYHKSQDVIKDLSELFPENPYDNSS